MGLTGPEKKTDPSNITRVDLKASLL